MWNILEANMPFHKVLSTQAKDFLDDKGIIMEKIVLDSCSMDVKINLK